MLGDLDEIDGRWRLTFIRRLPHPPEKVWRALTEPEHLAAWFPTDIEGERATGAALRFVFRHDEGPARDGEMLTYDPPSVLELRWGNDEILRFELQPDADGTILTFTNTFEELGKAARDAAGWHECLDLLVHDLAGEKPPFAHGFAHGARWAEVHPRYVERFGPEAATSGPPDLPSN